MNKNVMDMPIEELEITVRLYNCLKAEGLNFVRDVVSRREAELYQAVNLGKKSMAELKEVLAEYGLRLDMKKEELPIVVSETSENLRNAFQISAYRLVDACKNDEPTKALEYSKLLVQLKHIIDGEKI
jgi:hypothetical protein